jgi:hypothetical protein
MPTDANPIIGAASLKSRPEIKHKNPMTTYDVMTDGNKSDQKSALNALRPMNPPQKNTTRTKTAKASRVWSVGLGSGSGKNARKMSADATAADNLPPKKPTTSRSKDDWLVFTARVR